MRIEPGRDRFSPYDWLDSPISQFPKKRAKKMKVKDQRSAVGSLAAFVVLVGMVLCAAAQSFLNPYEGVDWQTTGHYDANFHTHTRLSDGRFTPHEVIDRYKELGYSILALTDHDSHHFRARPKTLYPWTEINAIYEQLKNERRSRGGGTWAEEEGSEWQDRDPAELGMVAIEGSEISNTHHIGSYFNDYAGGTGSEEVAFKEIVDRNGLAVFFHPGRYDRSVDWYVDFYEKNDHLIGMEVYNQNDRYPGDRAIWDRVLHRLMPERPVWGFANDDMHSNNHLGRNRNVMLLPELNAAAVRTAMENGHSYFYVASQLGAKPAIKITDVKVAADSIALSIEGDVTDIQWITHNPAEDDSVVVGDGAVIDMADVPEDAVFVRAVVICADGRAYTQPFGIRR